MQRIATQERITIAIYGRVDGGGRGSGVMGAVDGGREGGAGVEGRGVGGKGAVAGEEGAGII